MSEGGETFEHDEDTFERVEVAGSVVLANAEVDYGELFSEVIWDGLITADKRARLDRAADIFGIDKERARKIEEALQAAYEARHRVRVREEESQGTADAGPQSLSPFEQATDPRLAALQRRIAVLEAKNEELAARNTTFQTRVAELEAELARRASADVEMARTSFDVEMSVASEPPTLRGAKHDGDPEEFFRRFSREPRDVELLRALHRTLKRASDVDRRWCTAQALCFVGVASDEERIVFLSHRADGLIKPKRSVNQSSWHELLLHPDEDVLPGEIFSVIAPAVLLGRVASLRRERALPALDPARRIEPAGSTIQAVRCMSWAAAILGMETPPLYADPEYAGVIETVLVVPPVSRLGRGALSGRSANELAFAAGRHLSWYRPEHVVVKLTSSTRELEDLFLAALTIGNPGLPITADVRARVEPVARAIEPLLDAKAVERLRAAFLRFIEEGGRTHLRRWAMAADRTAARAGLLLASDLEAAKSMLELEDPRRAGDLMDDLIVFAASERYTTLRRSIGISVDAS